jgi:Ca2+:H+ antiporter
MLPAFPLTIFLVHFRFDIHYAYVPSCSENLLLMRKVDSVRKRAHRVALAQHQVGAMSYNPFARTRSRERMADVENLAHRAYSEPVPIDRPKTSEGDSNTHAQPTLETYGFKIVRQASVLSRARNGSTGGQSTAKTGSMITGSLSESNRSTLRARIKGIFSKTQDREDDELARVESVSLSPKERKTRSLKRVIPIGSQIRAVLLYNWVTTLLLPCIAIGFTVNYIHANAVVVFCINFAAIIPSSTALSVALNDLNVRSGEKIGALLNQTFGYALQRRGIRLTKILASGMQYN